MQKDMACWRWARFDGWSVCKSCRAAEYHGVLGAKNMPAQGEP